MTTTTKTLTQTTTNERTITMDCKTYLDTIKMKMEQQLGPVYEATDTTRKMYLEKLRKIVSQYIDESDVEISSYGLHHPVWCGSLWSPKEDISAMEAIRQALADPNEAKTVQNMLKSAIKEEMLRYSWVRIPFMLCSPYNVYALKMAQDFMTVDDFTFIMSSNSISTVWFRRKFSGSMKCDILNMLKACNPKLLESERERYERDFYRRNEEETTVYLLEEAVFDVSELSSRFCWLSSKDAVIRFFEEQGCDYVGYGVYTAKIKTCDIFGFIRMYDSEIILNPDKLYDIQYVKVPDLLEEYEREELREYIIRNHDYDPEENSDDED